MTGLFIYLSSHIGWEEDVPVVHVKTHCHTLLHGGCLLQKMKILDNYNNILKYDFFVLSKPQHFLYMLTLKSRVMFRHNNVYTTVNPEQGQTVLRTGATDIKETVRQTTDIGSDKHMKMVETI